jgi:hypothetical protein
MGRWDAALGNLGEVVEISINLGDREMIGKSFRRLADTLIVAGRFPQAVDTARRGLAYLEGEVSVNQQPSGATGQRGNYAALPQMPQPQVRSCLSTSATAPVFAGQRKIGP